MTVVARPTATHQDVEHFVTVAEHDRFVGQEF